MLVRDELIQYIDENMDNYDSNSKQAILDYYGFIDGTWPDIREVGKKYTAKENTKYPGARPNQITGAFKKVFHGLGSLEQCEKILLGYEFISASRYAEFLFSAHLVDSPDPFKANIRGIVELLKLIGCCQEYKIFRPDLKELKRLAYQKYKKTFIINCALIDKLNIGRDKAYSLPGNVGLANFNYLLSELGENYTHGDKILELIRADENNVIIEKDSNVYYFVKQENNTFLLSMGKIFNGATTSIGITEAANALYNTFTRRGKKDIKHPPVDVIEEFIRKYRDNKIEDHRFVFQGKSKKLSRPELYIKELLLQNPNLEITDINDYLDKKGVKKSNIQKVRYSPILRVDRSEPGHHKFSIVGIPIIKMPENEKEFIDTQDNYSDEDQEKDWKENRRVGKDGEKLVQDYLQGMKEKNKIEDFYWVSEKKVNSSYDFKIIEIGGSEIFIEVKSTKNNFCDAIYFSCSELRKAQSHTNYQIYRVYKINDIDAKLRICKNFSELAKDILDTFAESETLANIMPVTLSLSPNILDFDKEKIIHKKRKQTLFVSKPYL